MALMLEWLKEEISIYYNMNKKGFILTIAVFAALPIMVAVADISGIHSPIVEACKTRCGH